MASVFTPARNAPARRQEPYRPTALNIGVREQIIDEEHLRLLSIGFYIAGGLHVAFASMFIFHFIFFAAFAANPDMFPPGAQGNAVAPDAFFHVFLWVFGTFILMGWLFGALTIYAGRCVKSRSRRTLSMVMAALNTLAIPVGTIIGVCRLLVLSRASIKRLYGN